MRVKREWQTTERRGVLIPARWRQTSVYLSICPTGGEQKRRENSGKNRSVRWVMPWNNFETKERSNRGCVIVPNTIDSITASDTVTLSQSRRLARLGSGLCSECSGLSGHRYIFLIFFL